MLINNIELGISTGYFYEKSIFDILQIIKSCGFNTIELWTGPEKYGQYTHFDWHCEENCVRLKKIIKELNLKVYSIHAPYSKTLDISLLNEELNEKTIKEILKIIIIAKFFDVKYLILHTSEQEKNNLTPEQTLASLNRIKKNLGIILAQAKEFNIIVDLETQLPHLLTGDPNVLLNLIENFPNDLCGICLDTGHSFLNKDFTLTETFNILKDRIHTFHLQDNNGNYDDHLMPGNGAINWQDFFSQIKKNGYSILILEFFGEKHKYSPQSAFAKVVENLNKFLK